MSKVAIVILNWNGLAMLEKYLPTVLSNIHGDVEVVVADNASTDDSVVWLTTHFPGVHQVVLEQNWGFAEGYNLALRQVEAEYYVLLNSDVKVTEDWLSPLLSYMENHPDVAACQPKLLSLRDEFAFEYAGASGGFLDKYGYPFCRGRIFDTIEKDSGQYDDVCDVLWATGACLMIRSLDFWRVKGFDKRFFAHNEEIDLCWRLHRLGRRIVCVPSSKVYHLGGGTLPKDNPVKTFLNFRNNLTMLYKNLPDADLKSVMHMRWFLDYLAAIQTLVLNGHWGDCKAIFRARRAFKKWRHEFDAERSVLEASTVDQTSIPARKPYSILWKYYAKGCRRYSDLK